MAPPEPWRPGREHLVDPSIFEAASEEEPEDFTFNDLLDMLR